MPIYEFRCPVCEKTSEMMMKISDPHPDQCLACGAKGPQEKLFSRTSFVLKGQGWYETDFKKPSASASKPAATDSAPCGQGACEKKGCSS